MEEAVNSSSDNNRIIVALDYNDKKQALALSKKLDPSYCRLKIGKQLFTKYGPAMVEELQKMNFEIFLDLKFHDIPITVYKACSEAYKLGIWMLNIHLLGGKEMVLAARKARDEVNKKSKIILKVRNVSSLDKGGNYNFDLYKGEVLGIAGLLGSGRSRIARLLYGLETKGSGNIIFKDNNIDIKNTIDSNKYKIALVPEDRRLQGLILNHSIKSNIELPNLNNYTKYSFVNDNDSIEDTKKVIEDLNIKTLDKNNLVSSLSGGNQQKVVIGKWKISDPEILILDEATAGIDIGSKGEVLDLVNSLAQEGKSIIFISSELTELLAISDRIAIVGNGQIKKIISKNDLIKNKNNNVSIEQQLQFLIQTSNMNEALI